MTDPIIVRAHVPGVTLDHAFAVYTTPADICRWNAASDDWHCPSASMDLRPGGQLLSRMEARDGSMGFDFGATITAVEVPTRLAYRLGDVREVEVTFAAVAGGVEVTVAFEGEDVNTRERQQYGWQAILDRFAKVAAE